MAAAKSDPKGSLAVALAHARTLLARAPSLAEEQAREILRAVPGEPEALTLHGLALAALGRSREAITALARQPDAAKIWLSYGHALKTLGRQDDSVAAYRRCIGLEPGFGEAWWSLANLKTVRLEAADMAAMTAALVAPGLADEDRFHLHFALGKALEDADDVAGAFGHYAEGNRLRLAALDYDPAATTARVDRSVALLRPGFLAARAGQGSPASDPIFVLGMPRSGSTLIEQILASHPLVEGTQELPDIQMIAGRLTGQDEESYPGMLADLDAAKLRALGEEYLERASVHRKTGRPYFIDKMPNNWAHVGLIHLILPNARIIDARRHPLGCGFSNFKQHFARGQGFSYGLETMGRYYADYVRMMDHVDAVLPGRVHRVHYEAMVEDTEAEVRRLLAALGLPFDSACLRFHESGRAVRTASSEQVRRPIYREALDQWQRFDPYLGSLRRALGTVLHYYPHRSDTPEAVQQPFA